jgi:uncharacterized protein (DUF433 family)
VLPMSTRIAIDPDICNGQPVIKGTRITAQTVLEFLGTGVPLKNCSKSFPRLIARMSWSIKFSSELMRHHFTLREVA